MIGVWHHRLVKVAPLLNDSFMKRNERTQIRQSVSPLGWRARKVQLGQSVWALSLHSSSGCLLRALFGCTFVNFLGGGWRLLGGGILCWGFLGGWHDGVLVSGSTSSSGGTTTTAMSWPFWRLVAAHRHSRHPWHVMWHPLLHHRSLAILAILALSDPLCI